MFPKYFVIKRRNGLYFAGYDGDFSSWTGDINNAALVEERVTSALRYDEFIVPVTVTIREVE